MSASPPRDLANGSLWFRIGVPSAVAGSYAIWLAMVSPAGEFPLEDDWAYAWSVRHLLEAGELRISEWVAASAIVPILWGAGFATLSGGASFTALRVSTLLFGVVCPLALCVLARRSNVSRSAAAVAALALLTNPLFVSLSYTFMTDVFFLGLMLISLVFYEDGVERDAPRALLIGSIFAALAYLTRQLGVSIPLAAALVLVARRGVRAWRPVAWAALVPALVFLLHQGWIREVHGVTWGFRLNVVENGLAKLLNASAPLELAQRLLQAILYLGVFSLPALVAVAASWRLPARRVRDLAGAFGAFLLLLAGYAVYAWEFQDQAMPYLSGLMGRSGLGSITIAGAKQAVTPAWAFDLVTWVSPCAGAALAALGLDAIRRSRRELARPGAVVLACAFGMASLTALSVQLWDEYLLVFLPAALLLVLREAPLSWGGLAAGVTLCAVMLAYALPEQADHMAWNEARWRLGHELIAQGTPAQEIDGGFEWLGLYDFEKGLPIAIARGQRGNLFGWAEVFRDRYLLSFEPQRGTRVVTSTSYDTRFGPQGRIYVLEYARP